MKCKRCGSERVLEVSGKCDDRCCVTFKGVERVDYPPRVKGVCGNDYIGVDVCLECGQVQGSFPVADPEGMDGR